MQQQLAVQNLQKVQPSGIDRASPLLLIVGALLVLPFAGAAGGWGGVIILLLIALFPALAASNRGESFINWYCYGVMLWIVAMPHSLLLKDSKKVR
jgi:hypothetical protein